MSTHVNLSTPVPVFTPAFTDDPTQANLDGYYYAPIKNWTLLERYEAIHFDFHNSSPTKLSKGSYISYKDISKDSFSFYLNLHAEQKQIQLQTIIIKNILYFEREAE